MQQAGAQAAAGNVPSSPTHLLEQGGMSEVPPRIPSTPNQSTPGSVNGSQGGGVV